MKSIRFAAAALIALALVACGNKGPLFLPQKPAPVEALPAPPPEPAPADDALPPAPAKPVDDEAG